MTKHQTGHRDRDFFLCSVSHPSAWPPVIPSNVTDDVNPGLCTLPSVLLKHVFNWTSNTWIVSALLLVADTLRMEWLQRQKSIRASFGRFWAGWGMGLMCCSALRPALVWFSDEYKAQSKDSVAEFALSTINQRPFLNNSVIQVALLSRQGHARTCRTPLSALQILESSSCERNPPCLETEWGPMHDFQAWFPFEILLHQIPTITLVLQACLAPKRAEILSLGFP